MMGLLIEICALSIPANLFVASTAVLPTSSQANPTLTAIALGDASCGQLENQRIAVRVSVLPASGRVTKKNRSL